MQKSAPVHLVGISKSRLDARIADNLISINANAVLRRDSDSLCIQARPCMSTNQ